MALEPEIICRHSIPWFGFPSCPENAVSQYVSLFGKKRAGSLQPEARKGQFLKAVCPSLQTSEDKTASPSPGPLCFIHAVLSSED